MTFESLTKCCRPHGFYIIAHFKDDEVRRAGARLLVAKQANVGSYGRQDDRLQLMHTLLGGRLTFDKLDETLSVWARRHGLQVSTQFKDDEVRSITIVDDAGCEYQLWLSLLPPNRLKIAAWDYADRNSALTCEAVALPGALESGYGTVEQWIREHGHTRTPVS